MKVSVVQNESSLKPILGDEGYSRKLRNFMGCRLAFFMKNFEKFYFEISILFALINDNVMQNSIRNCPLVMEHMASKFGILPIPIHSPAFYAIYNIIFSK
ncbi:hypothetical protein T12_13436 [Trichinella patagoniensis]|uniref:Uncharacterized protein n=1 Tax=Trichinella patagoniensis TaxID=990121 RepID=A0A0V0ZU12_9BILA|nr:hypothetical protein T12_13436 [Trichinella patagoniensis]